MVWPIDHVRTCAHGFQLSEHGRRIEQAVVVGAPDERDAWLVRQRVAKEGEGKKVRAE